MPNYINNKYYKSDITGRIIKCAQLANRKNRTTYIGVTNNLFNRAFQHKLKENINSYTAKYNVNKLVYYEIYQFIQDAIEREKELKRFRREWKIELIEKDNPAWRDLFLDIK